MGGRLKYVSFRRGGFTLIELLVVIAIIGLLLAILIPSLAAARERADTVKCAMNMRTTGQLVMLFAGEHDGRGPGGGIYNPHGGNSSTLAWSTIINAEVLRRPEGSKGTIGRFGYVQNTGVLSCPKYVPASSLDYSRPWAYNADATGGASNLNYWGSYGAPLNHPDEVSYLYPAPVTQYYFGAKLQLFRPDQFMMIESYAGNDITNGVEANNDLGQLTSDISGFPAFKNTVYGKYSLGSYGPAWRHPFFKGANFLCFDGHVDYLTPLDDVADPTTSFHEYTRIGISHWAIPHP